MPDSAAGLARQPDPRIRPGRVKRQDIQRPRADTGHSLTGCATLADDGGDSLARFDRSSCSHTVTSAQPASCSRCSFSASRRLFRSNLLRPVARDRSGRTTCSDAHARSSRGLRRRHGWPERDVSRVPHLSYRAGAYPDPQPRACSCLRSATSGLISLLRFDCMDLRVAGLDAMTRPRTHPRQRKPGQGCRAPS